MLGPEEREITGMLIALLHLGGDPFPKGPSQALHIRKLGMGSLSKKVH